MTDNENIITSGLFKGKRIEFASTNGIDMFQSLSEEFMLNIFSMEPGEYLISDESSLSDFIGLEEFEIDKIKEKIYSKFGVEIFNINSIKLLEIFTKIHQHRYGS